MLGAEKFEEFRAERGEHGLIQPKCVADTYVDSFLPLLRSWCTTLQHVIAYVSG